MSLTFKDGNRIWTPDQGWTFTRTYTGSQSEINNAIDDYIAKGLKVAVNEGVEPGFTVFLSEFDGKGGDFTDRFNLVTTWASVEMFLTPAIRNYLGGTDASYLTSCEKIKAAMKTPGFSLSADEADGETSIPSGYNFSLSDKEADVYTLRMTKGTTFEVKKYTLRRTRTILLSSASRLKVNVKEKEPVWTTSALIAAFQIPVDVQPIIADIAAGLPAASPTASTFWAWRMVQDESQVVSGTTKATENRAWAFDVYPKLQFALVT